MANNNSKSKKQQIIRNNEYYSAQDLFDELYQKSLNGEIFNNLTALIFSRQNIMLAYRSIKSNAGSNTPGTDGLTIRDIKNLTEEEVCGRIQKITKRYSPRPVRRKEIPKPDGSTRPLGIPCIWDRVIQQCILQVLQPICEAKFSENSHGFRPLRSAEHAIASTYSLINVSKLHYVIELDIKSFFDNVDHSKLIRQIWSLGVRDKRLICIIKQILKAKIELPNGDIINPVKGTPQGGIISPLLANIALNEFDRWIESQWQSNPVTNAYHQSLREGRPAGKGTAYRGMRRTTNLKEMYLVRYADDIRIFCRHREDAERVLYASTQWLQERLHLEVSKEKTKIVNLKSQYMNFLGIKIKVDISDPKLPVKSHICDKAKVNIAEDLREQIKNMQRPQKGSTLSKEIFVYNTMVRGIHNYYNMATRVAEDFSDISHSIEKALYNRLKNYGISKNGTMKENKSDFKKYGQSKCVRYIGDMYILPINYVAHKPTKSKRFAANIYTQEGRKLVHDVLEIPNAGIMKIMANNPIPNRSVQYNDNRISKFSGQQGKCAVTGEYFESYEDIHTHHVTPVEYGGTDDYNNLALVKKDIHILIHATQVETINKYLSKLNLNAEQIQKLNEMRIKAKNNAI